MIIQFFIVPAKVPTNSSLTLVGSVKSLYLAIVLWHVGRIFDVFDSVAFKKGGHLVRELTSLICAYSLYAKWSFDDESFKK